MYPIKIALRTLLQGRMYTFINILGLTLGIAACMLIASVVIDELSYDRHWTRSADIYRLITVDQRRGNEQYDKNGAAYSGLAPLLKQDFSEVEEYSTLYVSPINIKFDKEDNQSVLVNALYTDSAVHQLLDIRLVASEDLVPVRGVNKVIVSEKIAKTYFKDGNALGKTIYDLPRYDDKSNEYLVVGVMKDMPANTHLRSEMVMLENRKIDALNNDGIGGYARHYILLKTGTDPQQLEDKVNLWYKNRFTKINGIQYELQPITDSYLKSDFGAYQIIKGNIQHIYIFSGVSIFVLVIACINFVNLCIARASSRLKETGIRKVLGASKGQLIRQFLLESLFTFGFAMVLALFLYYMSLPFVEKFIGHPLADGSISGWKYRLAILTTVLGISLLSGLYPAGFIAGFSIDNSLRKSLKTTKSTKSRVRSALVATQFSLSILVLVALFVVQDQVDFMKNKEIGIDTDGLVSINHISFDNKSSAFKHRLSQNPDIISLSLSSWLPTDGAGYMVKLINDPKNPEQKQEIWYIAGEPNLAKTLGLTLEKGRFLNDSLATDFINANDLDAEVNAARPCIMTASTARLFENPSLNTPLINEKTLVPVGIVQDFNSESLHKTMVPTVIVGYSDPSYGALLIRTIPHTKENAIRYIAQVWKEFYPDKLLDLSIVKDTLMNQYKAEEKMEQLFTGFSAMALFLAALGLFGLIVNSVSLRTKEIGIRKVLGASVPDIVTMLSKDFVKLVLIAICIASPIAWWAMNKWLEDFAYRIDIEWWIFALAGLAAMLIALLTVSGQAIRAAVANPVDSLRDE